MEAKLHVQQPHYPGLREVGRKGPALDLIFDGRWEFMTVLRSHTLDVCDLSWSPSSLQLVSASVDNTGTVRACCVFSFQS